MDICRRLGRLGAVLLLVVPVQALGAEARTAGAADSTRQATDEEWLKTVWGQIDSLIIQEDYELQETVVTSGVRGAEAADLLLDNYYFKGGKRYSAEQMVEQLIGKLERQMGQQRRAVDRARLRYLSAICYDMLGNFDQARGYYTRVAEDHARSPYAARARQRLAQLEK